MTALNRISPFMRAVVLMLVAIVLFNVMAAIIKHLGTRYPSEQLSMMRNLFGIVPSVLLLYLSRDWIRSGKRFRIRQWKLALVRGLFVTAAQYCFYLALARIDFATASTISFSGPLFVTALSIPILGHMVGGWRWFAVIIGFVGILLVMRPGTEIFNWFAILPLIAAFGYACMSVTARLFDSDIPTPLINIYSSISALAGSTILVLATGGYVGVENLADWAWLLAMGCCGGTAVFLMISAYRLTAPSSLSPFEYFGIPLSFLLGWMFFAETPIERLIPGVFFIIAGGLLIVWRERLQSTKQAKKITDE